MHTTPERNVTSDTMAAEKTSVKSLTERELRDILLEMGEKPYRASQIHRWLFSERAGSFDAMTNLGTDLREKLSTAFTLPSCSVEEEMRTAGTGPERATTKFLVSLHDGLAVETVLIPAGDRRTVCVSSQVGCPLECGFCATGRMGFSRNLEAAEIAEQVYLAGDRLAAELPEARVTNVVFMGMGEPLLNLPNVTEAVKILSRHGYRFSIPQKRITISTVGLVPRIGELLRSGLRTKLAVSLHAAEQEKRASLIPPAKEHTLDRLRGALAEYASATREPVTIVYMLMEGVNDGPEDARLLARYCRSFLCKINLIDYNSIINIAFRPVGERRKEDFIRKLLDAGLQVTVRKSYGSSINAACGQLAVEKTPAETGKPQSQTGCNHGYL